MSDFPYKVSIDHGRRTIVLLGAGDATTAQTLQLINAEQHTFIENPGYNVLYDACDLRIVSSAADMVKVADALFGASAPPINRFAVLVPESRAQLAMMFTALAQTHGVSACVFTDRADAWKWLEHQ